MRRAMRGEETCGEGGVASVGVWREREGEREERQERESVGRTRVSVALGGTVLGGRERHMDM